MALARTSWVASAGDAHYSILIVCSCFRGTVGAYPCFVQHLVGTAGAVPCPYFPPRQPPLVFKCFPTMIALRPRHQRGGTRGPSIPWVASPAPPTTPPALTSAAAAATITKALHAPRSKGAEWNTGWAEWDVQHKRKKSEKLQANKEI